MAVASDAPVLVGPVPLLFVQRMTLSEGYRVKRIAESSFSQAIAPTVKSIAIEAILAGPDRLRLKKELEALALVSRVLVAATAPALAVAGIPVVSGLTISLDMQIIDLRFSQSTEKLDALDVSITLEHVPRSSVAVIAGEAAELLLAAGTALITTPGAPSATPRASGL